MSNTAERHDLPNVRESRLRVVPKGAIGISYTSGDMGGTVVAWYNDAPSCAVSGYTLEGVIGDIVRTRFGDDLPAELTRLGDEELGRRLLESERLSSSELRVLPVPAEASR